MLNKDFFDSAYEKISGYIDSLTGEQMVQQLKAADVDVNAIFGLNNFSLYSKQNFEYSMITDRNVNYVGADDIISPTLLSSVSYMQKDENVSQTNSNILKYAA